MVTYKIFDDEYFEGKNYAKVRKAARAVILDKENIFIEETKTPEIVMLPGGGVEGNENWLECVKRECLEECGLIVEPKEELFAIEEYYKDTLFYSVYIKCDIVGTGKSSLTDSERKLGLCYGWKKLADVSNNLQRLISYYPIASEHRGMHIRENTALEHIIKHCSKQIAI